MIGRRHRADCLAGSGSNTFRRVRRMMNVVSRVIALCAIPLATAAAQRIDSLPAGARAERTIAIDERLAADVGIRVGDRVVLAPEPGSAAGDTVRVSAIITIPSRTRMPQQ